MDINNVNNILKYEMLDAILKNTESVSNEDTDSFSEIFENMLNAIPSQNVGENLNNIPIKYEDNVNNNIKGANVSGNIMDAVENASEKYGVDKKLILSVIKQESGFDKNAVSGAGAEGLMQLMPSTAKELGVSDPFNAQENVDGGTKYLSELLNMYGNNKELALASYNAGPNAVKNAGGDAAKLPYETQNYVKSIMKDYEA